MVDHLLRAAGGLGHAYRSVPWGSTPLGPMASWSPTLRSTLELALTTRVPVVLHWGPEHVVLYNEANVPLLGDKHPAALGAPAKDVFPEAWDVIAPMLERVGAGQGSTFVEDHAVPLVRRGFLEECHFTSSLSPVRGPDGRLEGIVGIGLETTSQVLSRRRLEMIGDLGRALVAVEEVAELGPRFVDEVVSGSDDVQAVEVRLPGRPVARRGRPLPEAPREPIGDRDLLVEDGVTGGVGHVVWLPLRSTARAEEGGAVLVVGLNPRLRPDRSLRLFLRLLASTLDAGLARLSLLAAERQRASGRHELSTALQRALLTQPMSPDDLEVAVRYEPAADLAQVGGDWHDAFVLPSGALALTVGDVAGHDREAAAAMAQARNLLRGIWFGDAEAPPSAVLDRLDLTIQSLGVATTTTAVAARVEQTPEQRERSERTLRWCNAGHPPPVVVEPDGEVRLLAGEPQPLLGLLAAPARSDRTTTLRPGSTVVLYTDGLVERRGALLDEGLEWLRSRLAGAERLTPDAICDRLLAGVLPRAGDDIALLVMRAGPQD
ncbi:SpoIIE family protein phosphatase [Nocardioides perillae]|uniref:Serine phosphatase RsbU (Regulator of sigma subunit) n=1 Tax=Nocardioides perillae TaxID=1119534 RepID=A0A7Y9RY39_9ACTN|nr:serine phosphatase RsbU (regulator of sigma subunit) [Nocardioides perillae]